MSGKILVVATYTALFFMIQTAITWAADDPADLLSAIKGGDLATTERLLAAGADPNAQIRGGPGGLIVAAFAGNADMVKLLLDKGAGVNNKTDQGMTALIIAAAKGHKAVVEILLARGADPNAQEASGFNAFQMATAAGYQDTADLLKSRTKITAVLVTKTVVDTLEKGQGCLPVMNFPDAEFKKVKCLQEGEEVSPANVFTNNNWTLIRKPVLGWVPTDKLKQVVVAQEQAKPAAKQSPPTGRSSDEFTERAVPSSTRGEGAESDNSTSMPSSGGGSEWWRRR
jgi:uncharacterized protein